MINMKILEKIFISILFIYLLACSSAIENEVTVAESLTKAVYTYDTALLSQLTQKDINEVFKKKRQTVFDFEEQEPFNEMLLKKLNDKSFRIIKIDTIKDQWSGENKMVIITRSDSTYHLIEANYSKSKTGNILVSSNIIFRNINKICLDYLTEPYRPDAFSLFKAIEWNSYKVNRQIFKDGKIIVENRTKREVSYIKFRLVLSDEMRNPYFSQTIEVNQTIPIGDIVKIDIPQLKDYSTQIDLSAKNVNFFSEVIDVLPKPENKYCEQLEILKRENRE